MQGFTQTVKDKQVTVVRNQSQKHKQSFSNLSCKIRQYRQVSEAAACETVGMKRQATTSIW